MNRNSVSTLRSSVQPFQPPPRFQVFHPAQSYVHPHVQNVVYQASTQPSISPNYVHHPQNAPGKYKPQGYAQCTPASQMQNPSGVDQQNKVMMFGSVPVVPQGTPGQVADAHRYAPYQYQPSQMAQHSQSYHPAAQGPAFGMNNYQQQRAVYGGMPANVGGNGSGFVPNSGQGSASFGSTSSSLIASIESALLSYFLQSSNHSQPVAAPSYPQPTSPSAEIDIHPILGTSYLPLRWDLTQDPSTGLYYGRHVSYDEYHEPAFCVVEPTTDESDSESEPAPGLKEIAVVVPVESSEGRGFATMEPDGEQRLYAFVVSAVPSQSQSRWEEIISASSMREVNNTSQSDAKSVSEAEYLRSLTIKSRMSERTQNQEENYLRDLELDVLGVLDGIRCGLREQLPATLWSALSLREKYVLAKRLSARRLRIANSSPYRETPPGFLLREVSNEDFFRSALVIVDTLPRLSKEGRREGYEECCAVILEAHRILDDYVFGPRPTASSSTPASSTPQVEKEPLRVIDLLGDKTAFKGLRLMRDHAIPGLRTDAFFLCVA